MSKFALKTNTGNRYMYSVFLYSKFLKSNGKNQSIAVAVANNLKLMIDADSW